MCRLVIAYAWTRFEAIEDSDKEGKERTLNKTSYNNSVQRMSFG